jgi:hypothetical protein
LPPPRQRRPSEKVLKAPVGLDAPDADPSGATNSPGRDRSGNHRRARDRSRVFRFSGFQILGFPDSRESGHPDFQSRGLLCAVTIYLRRAADNNPKRSFNWERNRIYRICPDTLPALDLAFTVCRRKSVRFRMPQGWTASLISFFTWWNKENRVLILPILVTGNDLSQDKDT